MEPFVNLQGLWYDLLFGAPAIWMVGESVDPPSVCRVLSQSVEPSVWHDTDPVYMSQLATTEKSVQQTSAKNPITGPVYMSKAPRSTEYFDRGVSENLV